MHCRVNQIWQHSSQEVRGQPSPGAVLLKRLGPQAAHRLVQLLPRRAHLDPRFGLLSHRLLKDGVWRFVLECW